MRRSCCRPPPWRERAARPSPDRAHGRHAGLVRGGQKPRGRAIYQIGNRLAVTWSARLAEHLGTLQGEVAQSYAARCIDDAGAARLAWRPRRRSPTRRCPSASRIRAPSRGSSRCSTRSRRIAAGRRLCRMGAGAPRRAGLRPRSRALRRDRRDARISIYVSPKSGQAVSAAAGAPYRERLLRLPAFLRAGRSAARPTPRRRARRAARSPASSSTAGSSRRIERKMPPARTRFR